MSRKKTYAAAYRRRGGHPGDFATEIRAVIGAIDDLQTKAHLWAHPARREDVLELLRQAGMTMRSANAIEARLEGDDHEASPFDDDPDGQRTEADERRAGA